jgi:hypothetical protein
MRENAESARQPVKKSPRYPALFRMIAGMMFARTCQRSGNNPDGNPNSPARNQRQGDPSKNQQPALGQYWIGRVGQYSIGTDRNSHYLFPATIARHVGVHYSTVSKVIKGDR